MLYNIFHVMLYNVCHVMLYNVCHVMLYIMCHVMLYNMCHVMLYNECHGMLYNINMLCYITCVMSCYITCVIWGYIKCVMFKDERGGENSRQLCKLETKSKVCITVKNSPNAPSIYIRPRKQRKKVFYCFYKMNFPRKDAKLFLWHWLKEKFLPVGKSCPRSLARVISSFFAKGCFAKYGLFPLKMSA